MSILAALRSLVAAPSTPPQALPPVIVQVAEPDPGPALAGLEPDVPRGLSVAAGYAWRISLLVAFTAGMLWFLAYFSAVTIPVVMAILLTAALSPLAGVLVRWKLPPLLAAAICLLLMITVLGAVMTFVGAQVINESPELIGMFGAGFQQLLDWLRTLPYMAEASTNVGQWSDQVLRWLQAQAAGLAAGAASAGVAVGNFMMGLLTVLITTLFFLADGRRMFRGTVNVFVPSHYREQTDRAGRAGWMSLVAYMRAAVIVAFADAAGVAVAAMLLGVPLVAALFALTFFLAFIPIVGAVVAGAVAVLLALISHGWVSGLIMLGAVILVMQLETNILEPIVMGSAVNLHALAVILGITVGAVLGGVVGALLAIPTLAFGVAFVKSLRAESATADPHSDDALQSAP